jgi:hypothetical protein
VTGALVQLNGGRVTCGGTALGVGFGALRGVGAGVELIGEVAVTDGVGAACVGAADGLSC